MEILKKHAAWMILLALPFLLGNKGCEGKSWEHPVVGKSADCSECHEGKNYSISKKPDWHDAVFSKEHGKQIRRFGMRTDSNCMVCHTQTQCTDCHMQEKPRSHTEFFKLKGHGLEVGLDRSRCMTCHKVDFCEKCHMETKPMSHTAAWGSPSNRHCLDCHYPISSAGGEGCRVCHASTPSHTTQPMQPANSLHLPGANCRSCHFPLRHIDNGMACTICHLRP